MISPILRDVYLVSILIHIIAFVIAVRFVIYLQLKEVRVRDALLQLRKRLLYSGLVIVHVCAISIIVLSIGVIIKGPVELVRYTVITLVLLHGLGFLAFAVIWGNIYATRYKDLPK